MRIAIADDHPIAIKGIKMMLAEESEMEVIGEYYNGAELLEGLKSTIPDVLILDVMLPDDSGLILSARISKLYPKVRLMAFTSLDAPIVLSEMLKSGCVSFLMKGATQSTLIDCINATFNNKQFIDPALEHRQAMLSALQMNDQNQTSYDLTNREREILQLIINGETTREIAAKLFVSTRTVDTHRLTLLKKLNAKNTADLVRLSMQLHLTQ